MGAPTNAYQTYQAIGNREDLIDVITMISPTKTPCSYRDWEIGRAHV